MPDDEASILMQTKIQSAYKYTAETFEMQKSDELIEEDELTNATMVKCSCQQGEICPQIACMGCPLMHCLCNIGLAQALPPRSMKCCGKDTNCIRKQIDQGIRNRMDQKKFSENNQIARDTFKETSANDIWTAQDTEWKQLLTDREHVKKVRDQKRKQFAKIQKGHKIIKSGQKARSEKFKGWKKNKHGMSASVAAVLSVVQGKPGKGRIMRNHIAQGGCGCPLQSPCAPKHCPVCVRNRCPPCAKFAPSPMQINKGCEKESEAVDAEIQMYVLEELQKKKKKKKAGIESAVKGKKEKKKTLMR